MDGGYRLAAGASLPPLVLDDDEAVALTLGLQAAVGAIAEACRDTERLGLGYTAAGGERTDRVVEPHRLVAVGRRWYLVAYDLGGGDWRSVRLDRLSTPRADGSRFAPRTLPAEDAAAFVRAGLDSRTTASTVEAVVAAPAADVCRRIGARPTVEEVDAGSCRVRMGVEWPAWAALALGAAGARSRRVCAECRPRRRRTTTDAHSAPRGRLEPAR